MIGSNVSILRKGLVLVCMPIGLQLVVLVCLLRLQISGAEADKWAVHTKNVMATADEAYRLVLETISQVRGAIITKNPDFTPDLALGRDHVLPVFDRLRVLVSDNPVQVQRVEEFRATSESILDRIMQERELVHAGKQQQAVELVARLTAQRNIEKLRAQMGTILDEEQKLDAQRTARVDDLRQQGYWFVGGTAVVTVGLAALVLWLFVQNVAQRLGILAQNAVNLANRRPLITGVEGRDEIGRVDRAIFDAEKRLADADVAEQRHREELEERAGLLANANSELARTNSDLEFKTQEIETFVYSVSHDLRSPLVNLQGFSKELARSCDDLRSHAGEAGVPDSTQRKMLEVIETDILESVRFIQTAVSRSSNIIDALLRLSRAGRLDYKRQPVDVAGVAARVVEAMQSVIRGKKAEVIVNPLPRAESDPTAVEQIFGNLIGNAVNYLDPKRPGRIEVGATPAGAGGAGNGTVQYYVKDNGLGIPAAYLSKMFVAFQRLHGNVASGEGIGLAMVKRMVDRLGGQIWVESVEGAGSTFFVSLPAAQVEDAGKGNRHISAAAAPAYSGSSSGKA